MLDSVNKLTDGCTVLSYIANKFGYRLKEEDCCVEHDEVYEKGGSLYDKVVADYKLAKCVYNRNTPLLGLAKASLGFIALSVLPYPYKAFRANWVNEKDVVR